MATPLTKSHILSIFSNLSTGNTTAFFANVTDDVDWLVAGQSHPLAGHWTSKQRFFEDSWMRVGAVLQKPMQLSIVGVIVEPEGEGLKGKAVVELKGVGGVLKDGNEYNNEYCWVVGFNEVGKIASVRAYLDTAKLRDALDGNE
ncbi:uncharacterized protein BDR25DRAFT_101890 [Lindgomyces ingoldianus]|uniref:Uncharacterized protein n=1 Tax=Lindgomyces ingoldianus TaxID=673940 RepID=A0ACB6R9B5_9PLEO|nr:uncharacterized protein BDR25DRAFT_101890 [Lindgomyces ingoldianus]KAF2475330.1 hypothetical protein BDR25DRAFT_101890 [Lindgomyces ingoldianus]